MQPLQQFLTLIVDSLIFAIAIAVVFFAISKVRAERLQAKASSRTVRSAEKSLKLRSQAHSQKLIIPETASQKPPSQVEESVASPLSVQKKIQITEKPKQTLEEKLLAKGDFSQSLALPELIEYRTHPDSQIRKLVASALGNIASAKRIRSETQQAISGLGQLSRDTDPSVRQAAAIALGKIKSEKVIPYLKQALRDFDSDVVKSASEALSQFKGYPVNSQPKKPLPKNQARKQLPDFTPENNSR
jgi:HEAT repeat protein